MRQPDALDFQAVHYAAAEGRRSCLKFLVTATHGSVLDIANGRGETPLHLAQRMSHQDCINYLVFLLNERLDLCVLTGQPIFFPFFHKPYLHLAPHCCRYTGAKSRTAFLHYTKQPRLLTLDCCGLVLQPVLFFHFYVKPPLFINQARILPQLSIHVRCSRWSREAQLWTSVTKTATRRFTSLLPLATQP